MDIVGGAYGGSDPGSDLRFTLETAKSWLETVMRRWETLTDQRRLELVAASLLSLNRLEMSFDALSMARGVGGEGYQGLRVEVGSARPSLVDLTVEESRSEPTARVELVFQNASLVGEWPCRAGSGTDHAAPARATLQALRRVLRPDVSFEDATVFQILDRAFALVTLRHEERLLLGSAMIQDELGIAMARATLDATNRFIRPLSPHEHRTVKLT